MKVPSAADAETRAAPWMVRCRRDPVYFVRAVFGANPTAQQQEALRAIAQPGAKISIRSGHGTGKTTVLAWVVLWFLFCFRDCRIPCTAPTGHQLYDLLWAEAEKWIARIEIPNVKLAFEASSTHIRMVGSEKTRFAVAVTARPEQPEALAGFHATNLLYIIDEASGIHDKIFEVSEGALTTPGARVIMAGNPTRMSGYFFRSHHADRKFWTTLHWDSCKSPLVDAAFVKRIKDRYGEDSNVYRVRVRGEFPTGGDDIVIPLNLVIAARANNADATGLRRAGLDVARFGDDANALVIRAGNRMTFMEQWTKVDLMATSDRVLARFRDGLFDCLFVDTIGIGAGVADYLRRLNKFPVYDVDVSKAARSDQYQRLRDELWFRCREWFQGPEATLPGEHALIETVENQLCSVTYKFAPGGKYLVQSKDDIKKAGGESPNLADALCLTFADTDTMLSSSLWAKGAI